jgi:CheY-like chemotaxis protein
MSTADASVHDSKNVVGRYRIVIVMASFDLAITLKRLLEMLGYTAETATDGQAALELVISMQPDAVISAIKLAGLDGFELASRIRDSLPRKPLMIANTAYAKTDIAKRAK